MNGEKQSLRIEALSFLEELYKEQAKVKFGLPEYFAEDFDNFLDKYPKLKLYLITIEKIERDNITMKDLLRDHEKERSIYEEDRDN